MAVALADTRTTIEGGTNLTGRTGTSVDVDKGVAGPTATSDNISNTHIVIVNYYDIYIHILGIDFLMENEHR